MGLKHIAAGAVATGIIDAALEIPVNHPALAPKYVGKWPYVPTVDPLPNVDDWFVLAVPSVAYLLGRYVGDKSIEDFGLGGLLYAGSMFIHHIILKAVRMMPTGGT